MANRLGLYDVKTELENLSFKFRYPREYENMVELIAGQKETDKTEVECFIAHAQEVFKENAINAHVELRYRHHYSTWCNKS